MTPTLLCLLSPYRLPTRHQLQLNADEVAAWLNGYLALWHPAALVAASGLPRVSSSYDHDFPTVGQVFAVPVAPQLFQADDWPDRRDAAGAVSFSATPDRSETLTGLMGALRKLADLVPSSERPGESTQYSVPSTQSEMPVVPSETPSGNGTENSVQSTESASPLARMQTLLDAAPEQIGWFRAIGFGHLIVETLFDAMEHEHLLDDPAFWQAVQQAAEHLADGDPAGCREHLQKAADQLLSARETLYPMSIHLIDLAVLAERGDELLPAAFARRRPLNLVASAAALERLAADQPERLAELRGRLQDAAEPPLLELCGGAAVEREDALLPVESQLWALRRARQVAHDLLGADLRVYARQHGNFHPQLPAFLQAAGLTRAVFVSLDDAVVPSFRSTVINWPAPDGKQVEALTRTPLPAGLWNTFFNLAFHLHETIRQDTTPTLVLWHKPGEPAVPVYEDLLTLAEFAPVLGAGTTLSRYFSDASAGEWVSPSQVDEFVADYLEPRTQGHRPDPISAFARHARLRRRLDTTWALASLQQALGGPRRGEWPADVTGQLASVEDALEAGFNAALPDEESLRKLEALEGQLAGAVAERLTVRGGDRPGYLLLNPCGFNRRVGLELPGLAGPVPVEGPVKAAQFDAGTAQLVVEVPALGFAWFPKSAPAGTPPRPKMRLADGHFVRNEFLEAEVDPQSGGVKIVRDLRTRRGRLAQQLVFHPGSRMQARSIRVTISGPALGELVTEGDLVDDHGEVLATFCQRLRAWLSRPVLELRIELSPVRPPEGYPWHAYYAARFAWRDEGGALFRGVNGSASASTHPRPMSPEFLEIRQGDMRTAVLTGGLPFHQKPNSRMVDVLLLCAGEATQAFDLALALDRDPAPLAQGFVTPVTVIPTLKGPPAVGPAGWLFHLDSPNVLLTSLRPAPDVPADQVSLVAQLLETSGHAGPVGLRCLRDPRRAVVLDADNTPVLDLALNGDQAELEMQGHELARVQVDMGI